MAEGNTLHDAFVDELRDSYDAEKQLTKALTKLAKAASSGPSGRYPARPATSKHTWATAINAIAMRRG